MRLREKLIHYTNDLGDVDLKQEAIATIEHIAQYMGEDELLHHSRPLAIAYLALTEDASGPVVQKKVADATTVDAEVVVRCKDCYQSVVIGDVLHCTYWKKNTDENGYCHEGG